VFEGKGVGGRKGAGGGRVCGRGNVGVNVTCHSREFSSWGRGGKEVKKMLALFCKGQKGG